MKDKIMSMIKNHKVLWISSIVGLMIVVTVLVWFLNQDKDETPDETPTVEVPKVETPPVVEETYTIHKMSVKALDEINQTVALDSKFEIRIEGSVSAKMLQQVLKVKPERAFRVMASDAEGVFELAFNEPLDPGQVVSIIYDKDAVPFGYAFETYKPLAVSSIYPGMDKVYVPMNTVIEVYFNKNIDPSVADYIQITPMTEGKVEVFNNVYRFSPSSAFLSETTYEITVQEGYTQDGEVLEAYSSHFKTDYTYDESGQLVYFEKEGLLYVEPDGVQNIKAYSGVLTSGDQVEGTFYQIENPKDLYLIHQLPIAQVPSYLEEMKGSPLKSQQQTLTYQTNGYNQGFFSIEENLSLGYYYLIIEKNGKQYGKLIQVTNYQGYLIADVDQLIVWLQSSGPDSLVSEVSFDQQLIGVTEANGLGVLDYKVPQDTYSYIEIKTSEPWPLLMPLRTGVYSKRFDEDYWFTTYTDRSVYLPTDKVYLSGYLQHKSGQVIDQVKVQLMYGDKVLEEKSVKVTKEGSYLTFFEFEDIYVYGLELHVFIGDDLLATKYFSVSPFVKPTFTMDFYSDKDVFMMGDTIELSGDVHYFEGTPVDNPQVVIHSDWNIGLNKGVYEQRLSGDAEGRFSQTFTPHLETTSWQPQYLQLNARVDQIDNYYDLVSIDAMFFPRDIMTVLEVKEGLTSGFDVKLTANEIDLTDYDREDYSDITYKGLPKGELPVELEVIDVFYEKIFTGQVYDEIRKVVRDTYTYNRIESQKEKVTLTTDAQGILQYNVVDLLDGHSYIIRMTTQDNQGRKIMEEVYYDNGVFANPYYDENQYVYMESSDYRAGLNDEVEVFLTTYEGRLPDNEQDRMLVITLVDGIYEAKVIDSPSYTFKFTEEMIPLVVVQAIYFDGQFLNGGQSYRSYIGFDTQERESQIEVTFSQATYLPGETVEGQIVVKNKDNQPLQGYYNLSVVDEAYFSMYSDYDSAISDIYQQNYNLGLLGETLATTRGMDAFSGAEGGEGGDYSIRSDFRNTAFFMNGSTDADGKSSFSFKVPDNLTKWRMTVTTVSDDLYVGKKTANFDVSQPFFMTAFHSDVYLENDRIGLTFRSSAKDRSLVGNVAYKVTVKDSQNKETIVTTTSDLGGYAYVDIGVLGLGTYELTMESEFQGMKDGIKKTIEVAPSRQQLKLNASEILGTNTIIKTNDQMVRLSFMNPIASERFRMMSSMVYNSVDALEYKVASYRAYQYLKTHDFDVSYMTWQREIPYYYIPDSNLYSSLYTGDGNVITTVDLLQMGWNEEVSVSENDKIKSGLIRAAMSQRTTYVDAAAALYGLALLGEPVLNDVRAALDLPTFTNEPLAVLYLIKALTTYGAYDEALTQLTQWFPGEKDAPYLTAFASDDVNVNKQNALLMAIMTDLNQEVKASDLYQLLKQQTIKGYGTVSEELYYLTHLPTNTLVSSFEITTNGEAQTINLDYNDYWTVDLLPDEAQGTKLVPLNGSTEMTTSYIGTYKDIEKSEALTMTTELVSDGSVIHVGDEVVIQHYVTSNDTEPSFRITDILPAGFIYVGNVTSTSSDVEIYTYDYNVGSETTLTVYASNLNMPKQFGFTISYKIRATAIGSYGYEPAMLVSGNLYQTSGDEVRVLEVLQ